MLPLVNIGLRAARMASEQVVRSMDRLDMIHTEGQDLNEHLRKLCQSAEKTAAYEIHKSHPEQEVIGLFAGSINTPENPSNKVWRINAIDGIEQYAHNIPMFSFTMSCYEDGKLVHAIIINSSNGDEYCASKGRGAQLNGRRIRVSKRTQLAGSQFAGGCSNSTDLMGQFDHYQAVSRALFSQGATLYSQLGNSLSLAYIASGRIDGLWHSQLDDTVDAGLLLAQEAGALVADFKGGKALNRGELVCANPKLLKHLLKTVNS
ncbi:MAG TPA: inositol monophosphatase [Oceanospirillaceae bacterium]|jgi:myo-inositol-1(or 4)-monophosphatase|nr:inositol monophosphatase [Oceanospirillaceae bacterium]